MASKLFRAVVGLGISFGTASVACLGGVDEVDPTVDAAGGEPTPEPARTPGSDAGATQDVVVPPTDGGIDAPADAAKDAPKDVMLDAFCDASWPTTKGTTSGPTCGPVDGCTDAGAAPNCLPEVDATTHTCENLPAHPPHPVAWCVSGTWQCSAGSVPSANCKCWVGQPCN